jgi:hypothetical protein
MKFTSDGRAGGARPRGSDRLLGETVEVSARRAGPAEEARKTALGSGVLEGVGDSGEHREHGVEARDLEHAQEVRSAAHEAELASFST